MAIESFLVTALPFSADPASTWHLSLFVTHRLTPDGPQGVVADFPHVSDWTAQLASAEFTVTGHAGLLSRSIAATPLLSALQPDLWARVFPPQLPVLPWQVPDPASLPWRTFPAHRMQGHALLAHTLSLLSSPVKAPTVAGNALATSLGNDVFNRASDYFRRGELTIAQMLALGADGNPLIDRLDQQTTAFLNRAVSATGAPTLTSGLLSDPETSSALLLAGDVHMARLYYQRAEEQGTYQASPSGAPTPPVVQAPPDFHRRASLLGDLSPLLRRLGLIIDVTVEDVSSLAGLTDISATIAIPGLANPINTQPRISCSVVGPTFTAVSSSGDYVEGMLRVGDQDAFTVLDLDPDASALKLEQYVRNLPRMAASENNGDAGSSAPSTLRATGFAIARNDRASQLHGQLANAPARDASVVAGQSAPLNLEDIARGVRLEVWDDVSAEWHSLHRRLLSVEIVDAGTVLADAPDTAFLQGASLTQTDGAPDAPLNAHEVLGGWDGWSLSAPRPGKRLIHDSSAGGGTPEEQHADPLEKLEDPATPAPDVDNPVASLTAVEPGTLPRLRYGRNYSFRAWAVDLAGNSSPHTVAGPPEAGDSGTTGAPRTAADEATDRMATAAATQQLAGLSTDATLFTGAAAPIAADGVAVLRQQLSALNPPPPQGPTGARAPGRDATNVRITGVSDLDRLIVARRHQRRSTVASRQTRIEQAVAVAAPQASELVQRTDTQVAPSVLAKALASAARVQPWLPPDTLVPALTGVVTTPRPFLRWEPVLEPTVVPRNPYSEGESLFTVVIRSGVEGPGPDGVTMTVIPPDVYVPSVLAAHPELGLQWEVKGQRHLLPPKSSQFECELHGLFDDAFGSGDPAAVKAALAIAIRESGTLLDTTIADPVTPGARIPQPGVTLITGPTADAAAHDNPDDIARGDGLSRGQYVIHDVDSVVVPYLPDPLADGVAFVFPDSGAGTELIGLLAVEGTQLPYSGDWPDRVPWRLVLDTGTELAADADIDVVTFSLPPGNQLRANLSSSLRPDSLDLLGIWRSLPAVLQSNQVLAAAAADGWLWWLTPATQLRFVHAVPRPIEAPRFTVLQPRRGAGSTSATLFAGVDLHGPTTGRLDIQASWSEWSDDVSKLGPVQIAATAAVDHATVGVDEDLVVLAGADEDMTLPDGTTLHVHRALHHLGDTKHRTIDYSLRATTRFQEYFDPRLIPTADDVSVVGPVRTANVLSTARPGQGAGARPDPAAALAGGDRTRPAVRGAAQSP